MGFTVSLFVAGLAFPNRELEAAANVGITIASAAAAIAGALLSSGERDPPGANSRRQTRSPQDPDGHRPTFLPPPARHVRTQPPKQQRAPLDPPDSGNQAGHNGVKVGHCLL